MSHSFQRMGLLIFIWSAKQNSCTPHCRASYFFPWVAFVCHSGNKREQESQTSRFQHCFLGTFPGDHGTVSQALSKRLVNPLWIWRDIKLHKTFSGNSFLLIGSTVSYLSLFLGNASPSSSSGFFTNLCLPSPYSLVIHSPRVLHLQFPFSICCKPSLVTEVSQNICFTK